MAPGSQKMVGWSHAATENPQGSLQIFTQGQHFSGTAFELDGTDNQDPILGIIVVNPNLDAVTEAKMTMQNYDAEFGKAVVQRGDRADQVGHQRISRQRILVPPLAMPSRRAILLRSTLLIRSRAASFRLLAGQQFGGTIGGADNQRQVVLLRRLPGHTSDQRRQRHLHGADRPGWLRVAIRRRTPPALLRDSAI